MNAQRLANGHILAPVTIELKDDPEFGDVIGEGQAELAPGDPDYDTWDAWLAQQDS